jgi:hypothetical protein
VVGCSIAVEVDTGPLSSPNKETTSNRLTTIGNVKVCGRQAAYRVKGREIEHGPFEWDAHACRGINPFESGVVRVPVRIKVELED